MAVLAPNITQSTCRFVICANTYHNVSFITLFTNRDTYNIPECDKAEELHLQVGVPFLFFLIVIFIVVVVTKVNLLKSRSSNKIEEKHYYDSDNH